MSGKALTNFNELNCLEYGTLKVPYELMNKKFRATQRAIDQCNFHFQKEFSVVEQKLKDRAQPIPLSEVSECVQKLNKIVAQFKQDIELRVAGEISACEDLSRCVGHLSEANSAEETARHFFSEQRLNRFIVDHLLRTGHFASAQALADFVGLDIQAQRDVYHVAKQVEESLEQHDLGPCLCWIRDNRSRLHRIGSSLETEVRIQQCIELIKEGHTIGALKYVQIFFGSRSDIHGAQWAVNANLLHLMGLLALGKDSARSEHQPLLSDDRYQTLITLFRMENERIYKFSNKSPFSACLQAGIAVHKTPHCTKQPESRCIVCSSVFELSEGLPHTHLTNSKLFCAISSEPFDCEENRPMMLPNGFVYGEKSIRTRAVNNEFKCPRTLQVCSLEDLQRVYVF
uniref:E3 ubiquitin-protein transferase MAEA n=1 Tax=Globodera rostochiensis TaxID=31243 RepID=A0A914H4G8_GLORO